MTAQTLTGAAFGERLFDGLRNGDLDGLMALMHPELEIHEPESLPYGGVWRGPQGFLDFIKKLMSLATLTLEEGKVYETDEGVILQLHISLTSHKDGEVFRTTILENDLVEDGQLKYANVFYKDVAPLNEFFARQ